MIIEATHAPLLCRAARQQAEDHASSLEALQTRHTGAMEQLQGQQGAATEALKQQHAQELQEVQKHSRKALKAAARRSSYTHHQVPLTCSLSGETAGLRVSRQCQLLRQCAVCIIGRVWECVSWG